jgi:precorrin-6B methylase 2
MRSLRSFADWHALRTYFLSQMDWSTSRRERQSRSFGRSVPWWSYSCTHFLEQVVPVDAAVLEFGAGASTAWWLERGNRVMALESSPEWIESVRESCANHVDRLELNVVDFDEPEAIAAQVSGPFHVIVIDNEGPRTPLVPIAIELLTDGGLIILDNADRDEYAQAVGDLEAAGFRRLDFFGLVPINAYASVTALFTKSDNISIHGRRTSFATVEY